MYTLISMQCIFIWRVTSKRRLHSWNQLLTDASSPFEFTPICTDALLLSHVASRDHGGARATDMGWVYHSLEFVTTALHYARDPTFPYPHVADEEASSYRNDVIVSRCLRALAAVMLWYLTNTWDWDHTDGTCWRICAVNQYFKDRITTN